MRNIYLLVFGLAAIAIGIATYTASRPDAGLLKFRGDGGYAYGYGTTKSRSLDDFRRFRREHPNVHTLVLKKMPGTQDMTTNRKIAYLIRREGLNTHLDADSFIASGAVSLFIAGKNRTLECGALLGVHSWRQSTPDNALIRGREISPRTLGADDQQKYQEKFLKDMGVDPNFYAFTRSAAPPDSLYFLRMNDMERFRILTNYPECA
jgi:hypothetical protein